MYSSFMVCETLEETHRCFFLRRYKESGFEEICHKHIPKHRMCLGAAKLATKALVVKHSGWGGEYTIQAYVNKRDKVTPGIMGLALMWIILMPGVAHDLAGLAEILQILGQFQEAKLAACYLFFGGHSRFLMVLQPSVRHSSYNPRESLWPLCVSAANRQVNTVTPQPIYARRGDYIAPSAFFHGRAHVKSIISVPPKRPLLAELGKLAYINEGIPVAGD